MVKRVGADRADKILGRVRGRPDSLSGQGAGGVGAELAGRRKGLVDSGYDLR